MKYRIERVERCRDSHWHPMSCDTRVILDIDEMAEKMAPFFEKAMDSMMFDFKFIDPKHLSRIALVSVLGLEEE